MPATSETASGVSGADAVSAVVAAVEVASGELEPPPRTMLPTMSAAAATIATATTAMTSGRRLLDAVAGGFGTGGIDVKCACGPVRTCRGTG